MAETTNTKKVLWISAIERDGYGHIKLQVNTWDDDKYEFANTYSSLGEMEITCQYTIGENRPYAFRWGYDNYGVTSLDVLEEEVKNMRPIQKKLDKMQEEWGYTDNYGQYVLRFAKAIGAEKVIVGYNNSFNTWKVTDIPWMIDRILEHQFSAAFTRSY